MLLRVLDPNKEVFRGREIPNRHQGNPTATLLHDYPEGAVDPICEDILILILTLVAEMTFNLTLEEGRARELDWMQYIFGLGKVRTENIKSYAIHFNEVIKYLVV